MDQQEEALLLRLKVQVNCFLQCAGGSNSVDSMESIKCSLEQIATTNNLSTQLIETTGIGHAINKLCRDCGDVKVKKMAKSIRKKWREMVIAETTRESSLKVTKKRIHAAPVVSDGNTAPSKDTKHARLTGDQAVIKVGHPVCGPPRSSAAVVNVKVKHLRPNYNNLQEWMGEDQNLYIGRRGVVFVNGQRFPKHDSKWHNPFKIDKKKDNEAERVRVLKEYRGYVTAKIEAGELNLAELHGKNLGCWCHPLPCHGHVLCELLKTGEGNAI